ncbi:Hypothetical predicted protein [Paramuricea clavata]|uniref:Uncharacterized protein n=1 Tax=Paramuricea clavata TaxID=317549 RepID=A0A7D9LW09_PARCT|nr:Hypothetical predicted protein [Paramuricea clavata]
MTVFPEILISKVLICGKYFVVEDQPEQNEAEELDTVVKLKGLNTAEIGLGGWNTWIDEEILEHDEDVMGSDDENDKQQLVTDEIVLSGESSEEDEKIMLTSSNLTDFQEKKVTKETATKDDMNVSKNKKTKKK